ncbi:MAG: 5'/3'-nucleotidase SurE [Pseudomonadota bacterium]
MRILVTNDDGINAPGLKILREIATKLSDDVWVAAPDNNQSGASHSLTLHEPLRCQEVAERCFAIRGTPTDCVIMGVRHILLDTPPDLILSGVNRGANIADDVTYSGTIAAAIEGSMLGIRSMALSQTTDFAKGDDGIPWTTALTHGPDVIRKALAADLPPEILVNINFPACAADDVAGIKTVRQGRRDQNLIHIDERLDGWKTPYYWFAFERGRSNPAEDTDLWAIYNNYIAVSPLQFDLTHRETLAALNASMAAERR